MRLFSITLVALLALIQYPLWLGKGGWLRVWDIERQLGVQVQVNARLQERNRALHEEVLDLKEGTGAIEERARYELGMMRHDEIFVQIADAEVATNAAPPSAGATRVSAWPVNRVRSVR
jgi:cell division protein FtsB